MIDFILFQIQWFLCVLNINNSFLYALGILLAQIIFLISQKKYLILLIVLILSLVGILLDTLLMYMGVLVFPTWKYNFIIPDWLVVLWFCFSLWYVRADYINQKLLLYTILCAIFGPLSYYVGMKLGALIFGISLIKGLMVISFNWLILGILFVTIYKILLKK